MMTSVSGDHDQSRATFSSIGREVGTGIKIEVIKGQNVFEEMYPCLAAVNRAAKDVPRHDGRVIWLTYEPVGPVEKTLMFVGKGITYDSGNISYYIFSFA